MANMACSRSVRGRFKMGSWCDCCDWVYNKKTRLLAKRIVRRKEKAMWRKDWNV